MPPKIKNPIELAGDAQGGQQSSDPEKVFRIVQADRGTSQLTKAQLAAMYLNGMIGLSEYTRFWKWCK